MNIQKTSININNVTVTYNGKIALNDVNLNLKSGSICGLVGMNGSGKSTLFKTIMGFIKPQQGKVAVNQMPIKKIQKENLMAYVPQSEEVDWNFPVSVWDVVMMGRYGYMNFMRIPRQKDKQIVTESLEKLQILDYKKRQIGELSGGQKKRTFIARALAQKADIILLDEPFNGVDIKTEKIIIDLLVELKTLGKTILISTHDLESIGTFCDEVILVNKTILAHGAIKDVFTKENLTRTFEGMTPKISYLF
jgi:ABC-type Mn2+/Zn2+ transport system ATPase subunit